MKIIFDLSNFTDGSLINAVNSEVLDVRDDFFVLLQSYQNLSLTTRGLAVLEASKENSFERAEWLMAKGTIHQGHIGSSLYWASYHNNQKLIKLLLSSKPITDENRGAAVAGAARGNNLKLVNFFLTKGPISDFARARSVEHASEHNNLELVQLLLANGPISDYSRSEALNWAVKHKNPKLVALLTKPPTYWKIAIGLGIAGLLAYLGYSYYALKNKS
jgi:ankyrin repeat protein